MSSPDDKVVVDSPPAKCLRLEAAEQVVFLKDLFHKEIEEKF